MVVYGAEFGAVRLTEGPRRARVQEGRHHFNNNLQIFPTDIRQNYLAIFCEVGAQPAERDAQALQLEKKANINCFNMLVFRPLIIRAWDLRPDLNKFVLS